jgi:transcription elongation GreA/GreB family factor
MKVMHRDSRGTIRLTRQDAARLARMAEALAVRSRDIQKQLRVLGGLMASARLVPGAAAPADVVTIGSRIMVEELYSGEMKEIELVFPEETNPRGGNVSGISVLSAIGSAVLGRAVGDRVVVETDAGCLPLRIAALTHQPDVSMVGG